MNCKKCHKPVDSTWTVCPYCATRVAPTQRHRSKSRRANGQGTAYKRGQTWTAKVILGWTSTEDGSVIPVARTRGGFATKVEALQYCTKLFEQSSCSVPLDITFEAIYGRWFDAYEARVTKSTMDCYKAAYKHCKSIHHLRFVEIRNDALQACIDNCPAGKRTKENIKAMLSLVYKYAMSNDLVTRNRAELLYTGNQVKGTREAFSLTDLEKIRASSDPYAEYVLCMCYLGFRPGEMLQLKKTSYDPEHRCLIGGGKTKAGTDRIVTISPKILPIIESRFVAEGSEYLFPRLTDGARMSDNYFRSSCFDPLMERLGIEGKVPYSCRHTFANLLKAVAGSDTDKAALIGHADASMTKYYQSADYDSLKAITDLI